jgi:hypothetical protein
VFGAFVAWFLSTSAENRSTAVRERFSAFFDAYPDMAYALMHALPTPDAKIAFSILLSECRTAWTKVNKT